MADSHHVMIIFGGGAGSIVKLRCPKCGEVQARARQPKGATYDCRKCGKPFTREDSAAAEAKAHAPRRKR